MRLNFLTVAEVADALGVSRSTVYRRIADGTLPAPIRLGALVRFLESDVDLWARGACSTEEEGSNHVL